MQKILHNAQTMPNAAARCLSASALCIRKNLSRPRRARNPGSFPGCFNIARQTIDPHVAPIDFSSVVDGEVLVQVHQVVRDLQGTLLADQVVVPIFRIEQALITRFDIRSP